MDSNEIDVKEHIKWLKRNTYVRLVILAILILLIGIVIYFKIGYQDPTMVGLNDAYGHKVIDCKDALYYYASHELNYNPPGYISNVPELKINLSSP